MRATVLSRRKRLAAFSATCAIALSGAIITQSAHADAGTPDVGNIDTDTKGTFTLHKRESGSMSGPGQLGNIAQASTGGTPVPGVTFTYYPITGLDLKTSEAWQHLDNLADIRTGCAAAQAAEQNLRQVGGHALGPGNEMTPTGPEGDTVSPQLPVGAYLVCETGTPTSVNRAAQPFVVTIPTPLPKNQGWTYNVHAYPKNTVIQTPTKTATLDIAKPGVGTKHQVTFTIAAKIPQLARAVPKVSNEQELFTYFVIGDSLIKEYSDGVIEKVEFADDANGLNATAIENPARNYTIQDSTNQPQEFKHWLNVTFTFPGRELLLKKANKYVIVTIKATANAVGDTGHLDNTGYLIVDTDMQSTDGPPMEPRNPEYFPPQHPGEAPTRKNQNGPSPITPTNKAVTTWGQAKLKKHSTDPSETPLKDAVFQIHLAEKQDDPTCPSNEISTAHPDAISVNGKTEFTSNNEGVVTVPGLAVGAGQGVGDAQPTAEPAYRCYVFVEKTPPLGYVLPEGKKRQVAVSVTPGQVAAPTVTMPNAPVSVPELPITGASGTVLATILGSSLLLAAVGSALLRRREAAVNE